MSTNTLRILVVEDDAVSLDIIAHQVQAAGHHVMTARGGAEALHILQQVGADIIISDWIMPTMDGAQLARQVRLRPELGFIYFIMLTVYTDKARLVEAFEAGVDDFISKPFHEGELMARLYAGQRQVAMQQHLATMNREVSRWNLELAVLNDKLHRHSVTDELTGLSNRRHAIDTLNQQWALARRSGLPLSCLLIDIDHFKAINDRHGHPVGDQVLRAVAQTLRRSARVSDMVARLGGEEFIVISLNQRGPEAALFAERLRAAIAEHAFGLDQPSRVTISIGVAQDLPVYTCPDHIVQAADHALYAAKAAGRNCIQLAPDQPAPTPAQQPAA